jgi:hypothetical protein
MYNEHQQNTKHQHYKKEKELLLTYKVKEKNKAMNNKGLEITCWN